LFERFPRIVRLMIDGEKVAVPLVVAMYLQSHPPSDDEKGRPPVKRGMRPRIEHWDHDEEIVWPKAIG